MRKITVYKCPECGKAYKSLGGWAEHMNMAHPEIRPKGYSDSRFFYFILTGRTHGNCIVCKSETTWNEQTGKYNRFCNNPKCKQKYKDEFNKRMMSKYGKTSLMDDPEFNRKALARRKIAGQYMFKDGGKVGYVASYEKDFLQMLDKLLGFQSSDIMSPSPHTYYYMYNGERHYYMPDFFIPNLNLEIEIKQNTSTHPKILAVDKIKEAEKDKVMYENTAVSYIKIVDKKYEEFIEYLMELKSRIPDRDINASPEKKQTIATESMNSERKLQLAAFESLYTGESSNVGSIETILESFTPEVYDALFPVSDETAMEASGSNAEQEVVTDPNRGIERWKDKVPVLSISDKVKTVGTSVGLKNHVFSIKGVNYNLLLNRIKEHYQTNNLCKIFDIIYSKSSWKRFKRRKISRSQMKIEELRFDEFFAIEMYQLFTELSASYHTPNYAKIAREIYRQSWLNTADKNDAPLLDLSVLDDALNPEYKLLPHQSQFITIWNKLKAQLNLRGYILAFSQGLGKTLSAVSLSLCLNKEKVYIVCPNTLTVNWAEELKLYLRKYRGNEKLWRDEVGIIGNPKYPITPKCKYCICNNEKLDKLPAFIDKTGKSTMLVVDESQNFRNYNGKRVQELLIAAKKINSPDVLLCSGTPIKAIPNEIVPSLMLIDPMMTPDVADVYQKAFSIDNTLAANIVNKRFGMVIYRKTKDELSLPNKNEQELTLPISTPERYLLSTVHDEVHLLFKEYYEEALTKNQKLHDQYMTYVDAYHTAPKSVYNFYVRKFVDVRNTKNEEYLHELDQVTIEGFVEHYVLPNIPPEKRKDFDEVYRSFIMMKRQCMGRALGKILPPRRAEMYCKLFTEHKEDFITAIENNTHKVVIFSIFLPVANTIAAIINEHASFKAVKIVGDVKDRKAIIEQFKMDDDVKVLVATSQTMGTGVTLTEANVLYFFGAPWRSTDKDQASDRIHRIGQTADCNIYTVLMQSSEPNLSSRMDDILNWSNGMFSSMIDMPTDDSVYMESMESSFDLADEGWIFDSQVYEYNTEHWSHEKGKNILFITGLSGSGKSSQAHAQVEANKNEKIISLNIDRLEQGGAYLDLNDPLMKAIGITEHDANFLPWKTRLEKYLPKALEYMQKHIETLFIMDGIQIYEGYIDKNILYNSPILILGTSAFKSFYRAIKRNHNVFGDPISFDMLYSQLVLDIKGERALRRMRKEVKQANEQILGSIIDKRPYMDPLATPSPLPEYNPINVIPTKAVHIGAVSPTSVKSSLPSILDEITGEPSNPDGIVSLPVKEINDAATADPDGLTALSDRDGAIKRVDFIISKFNDYTLLGQGRAAKELHSLITKWNIQIDLKKYPKIARAVASISHQDNVVESICHSGFMFDYMGSTLPDFGISATLESVVCPDDLKPVYILLTHSGSLLATIIQKFTKDQYSHSALVLDPSFDLFYTFGRKEAKGGVASSGGFTVEHRDNDFWSSRPKTPYAIYCVFVTSKQYELIQKKLQYFITNESKFKYHFEGLIKIYFKQTSENATKYFCSGFVADVLQSAGYATDRSYSLYKPQDFTTLPDAYYIDSGIGLMNINPDKINRMTEIAKKKYIKDHK